MTKYFSKRSIVKFRTLLLLVFIFMPTQLVSQAASSPNADHVFVYIKNILGEFDSTGRLVKNPGIDGADLEAFVEVLRMFNEQFGAQFAPTSPMCEFYLDPDNARMTIEERAEIAFSFLPSIERRIQSYQATATEFDESIEREFGLIVLENIVAIRAGLTSHQRLPSSEFDQAAVISFLDSACG